MSAQFWPYWLGASASFVAVAALSLSCPSSQNLVRQWRWTMMMLVYGFSAIGYGFLAFGESYMMREYALYILYGRWWLYLLVNPFAVVVVTTSITSVFINHVPAFSFTFVSSCLLVAACYLPIGDGSTGSALGCFFVAMATFAIVGLVVYLLTVAMDWPDRCSFQAEPRVTAVAIMCLLLLFYPLFFMLGPEGWDKYPGSVQTRESVQIWLTLAVTDGLFKFLFLPLVYVYFAPPDDTLRTPSVIPSPPTLPSVTATPVPSVVRRTRLVAVVKDPVVLAPGQD